MTETPESLQASIRDAHMQYLAQIKPFHGELHRYARGLTRCAFLAEDLCQEAVVRARTAATQRDISPSPSARSNR